MKKHLRTILHRCGLAVPLWLMGCAPCAQMGTLEAEYAAALQAECGNKTSAECDTSEVDAEFKPRFEEAESCRE